VFGLLILTTIGDHVLKPRTERRGNLIQAVENSCMQAATPKWTNTPTRHALFIRRGSACVSPTAPTDPGRTMRATVRITMNT
jgi:hypothetical protein